VGDIEFLHVLQLSLHCIGVLWKNFENSEESHIISFDRQMPHKPRLVGGIEKANGSRNPMGREAQWVERPNGLRGTIKNRISLARILLATACPGSPALWAGSFTLFSQ